MEKLSKKKMKKVNVSVFIAFYNLTDGVSSMF
jgi:hypothetical protein